MGQKLEVVDFLLTCARRQWLRDWKEFCVRAADRVVATWVKWAVRQSEDGKLRYRETPGHPRPRRCPECGCIEWHTPDCFITYQPEGLTDQHEERGIAS